MMNLITVKVTYKNGLYENIDCEKAEYDIEKNVMKFESRRYAS